MLACAPWRSMADGGSSTARTVAQQYDLFQASLESLNKDRKYLNYGYTLSRRQTYEDRQQQLCLEVFRAADIRAGHSVVDVGFGSGEQDFLLARTSDFGRLTGFNISARQVAYATARAEREGLGGRLAFRHGPAEALPGLAPASVDRLLAVECAFYFDRPAFYARAADVLVPGGRVVLADIAFADRAALFARRREDLGRVGTVTGNRLAWERHFRTRSVRPINRWTRPGAQMTVWEILRTAPFSRFSLAERREWLRMACYTQLVAAGLALGFIRYDLIVLEKP